MTATGKVLGKALVALLALAAAGCARRDAAADRTAEAARLAGLHRGALVWDCHNDLAYRVLYEGLDIGRRLPGGQVDIPRLREGGVDVQVVALFIQNYLYPDKAARQCFALLEAMHKTLAANAADVELARTGADIERITAAGKIAMPLSIEGGQGIENDLSLLRRFHEMGVSSMTLTHNISHDWADAAAAKPRWGGLNELGRAVVAEMNRLGMVVDLSHASIETCRDALETSRDPVIFSHSGCWAINPHRRNVSDEMLQALAANGGVVGIIFEPGFVSAAYGQARAELRAVSRPILAKVPVIGDLDLRIAVEHLDAGRDWPLDGLPTIEDLLDHIEHAVKIAGVDHVGLGADMYPRTPTLVGLRGAQDYSRVTEGLKRRGFSDEDVRKIMGGNFLRIWKRVTG